MGGEQNRDKWGNKVDFILSCLGYAVGLGNVWRFPYLCGRNGGAAFMIPYVIMMIFAGFPTFYLELAIGQFAALTPHLLYKRMCPIFTGIGYAMIMISVFTGIYYNMIIAWSMYYFGVSFQATLPWSYCNNTWNNHALGKACFDAKASSSCANVSSIERCIIELNDTQHTLSDFCNVNGTMYVEGVCLPISKMDYNTSLTYFNRTYNGSADFSKILFDYYDYKFNTSIEKGRQTPAQQYNDYVLDISDGIESFGYPKWDLVLCLFAAWILVFLCLIKGVKSSGKVVYFTATFPYVILLILLFRGVTLDGAYDGIRFYLLEPKWEKLTEAKVWGDAAIQIFFSLSLGGGGLTTLASYNEFHNNLLRDTLIVVLGNCLTSFFAGFVIFPIIGFVAAKLYPTLGVIERVSKVAASGPTLAFIAYPDALTHLPGAPFWAVLFFFMLILLGIDSQLVIVEVVITAIIDQWPKLRAWKGKLTVVGVVCIISFLFGLLLTCPGGPYLLNIVDTFAGGWPLVMACLAEIVMVAWVYGVGRFVDDIKMMMGSAPNAVWRVLGYPVNAYWWICWSVVTPFLLSFVLVFNWAQYERTTYGDYVYPDWAEVLGWLIALSCCIWIPLFAIIYYFKAYIPDCGQVCGCYRWLIEPSLEWGPADEPIIVPKNIKPTSPAHEIPMTITHFGQGQGHGNPAFHPDHVHPRSGVYQQDNGPRRFQNQGSYEGAQKF